MASCAIIPQVRNKNNEVVDSKLFRELTDLIKDRNDVVNIYKAIKLKEFQSLYPNLPLDDNNEPTLDSILSIGFDEIVGMSKLSDYAGVTGEYEGYIEGIDKALELNERNRLSESYTIIPKENKFILSKDSSARDLHREKNFHDLLTSTLERWGVSIGALTEHEEYLGLSGVTDFSRAKRSIDGVVEIIRLAKGEKGREALSEEFSHLALEMLNTPLKDRLYQTITEVKAREVLGDLYDTYLERYNHFFSSIQKEVAGKLLSQALENNYNNTSHAQESLLRRLVDFFKRFFSQFDYRTLIKEMNNIEAPFNKLAREILDGDLSNEMSLSNITASETLAKIEEVDKIKEAFDEALNKALEVEKKRLMIYKSDPTFKANQEAKIKQLEDSKIDITEATKGYSEYLQDSHNKLKSLFERMKELKGATLEEEASLLRKIKDYAASYEQAIEYAFVLSQDYQLDEALEEHFNKLYSEMSKLKTAINKMWKTQSKSIVKRIVEPLMGGDVIVPFGKNAGHVFNIDEMLDEAFEDIGMMERWFLPMNISSDIILQAVDYTLKDRLYQARVMALEYENRILNLQDTLGKGASTEFMFERDEKGNLTGNYISQYDTRKYNADKREFFKELSTKYGVPSDKSAKEILTRKEYRRYLLEARKWFKVNRVKEADGSYRPSDKYTSIKYKSLTPAQKEYHTKFLELKHEMELLLPTGLTNVHNAVKVRASTGELLQKGNIKGIGREMVSSLSFVTGEDSQVLGSQKTLTDFSGNIYRYLPMHYLHAGKGENLNALSTDASSGLIVYGDAIARYHQLNQIANTLEVTYQMLLERPVVAKKDGIRLFTTITDKLGGGISSPVHMTKGTELLVGRLRDYLDKNLYQEGIQDYKKEIGGKIYSAKKANDALMSYAALKGMGLNIMAQVANVLNGASQNIIESLWAKERFSMGDYYSAQKIYFSNLTDILKYHETGRTTNKLPILLRLLDANQDWTDTVRNKYSSTTKKLLDHLDASLLTSFQGMGDHYLKHTTAIALLEKTKVKIGDKEVKLLDALEVVYKDPSNKAKGVKLEFKEGVKNLLDQDIELDSYLSNLSQQMTKLNQKMYGVYNAVDKPALSKYILGTWALTFRNWLPRMLHERFARPYYDLGEKEWNEGYYTTWFSTLKQLYTARKNISFIDAALVLAGNKNAAEKLNIDEKALKGIRKVVTENLIIFSLFVASSLLSHLYGLDEEDKNIRKDNIAKMTNFDVLLVYFVNRLEIEMGTTSPFAAKISSEQAKQLASNTLIPASTAMDVVHNFFSMFYTHDIEGLHVGLDKKVWGKSDRYNEEKDPIYKYSKASTAATRLFFPFLENTERMEDPIKQAKALLVYRR